MISEKEVTVARISLFSNYININLMILIGFVLGWTIPTVSTFLAWGCIGGWILNLTFSVWVYFKHTKHLKKLENVPEISK